MFTNSTTGAATSTAELKKRVALVEQESNKASFNHILFDKMMIVYK